VEVAGCEEAVALRDAHIEGVTPGAELGPLLAFSPDQLPDCACFRPNRGVRSHVNSRGGSRSR